ncbi:MAG: ribosomal protein S18-alanine N-acetyltransferase [Endomicrobia bacterium]|nr:ribosomal protein S18-alanine N-acetyltransferase [Endomicrobiia bacterium]MCL2506267.1 ribosomal protein S18-alanine N-acetyltransferase [Endomicrobiia bacterium]
MKLVDFLPDFLNDIIAIEEQSFLHPWKEKMFLDSAANELVSFKVIVENEKVAGYCLFWILEGQAEILNIAVSPDFRRRSFAKQMLQYIIECSKEKDTECVFLDVRAGNSAAISLYESFGFEKTGIRKKYYTGISGKEDALILRKKLK